MRKRLLSVAVYSALALAMLGLPMLVFLAGCSGANQSHTSVEPGQAQIRQETRKAEPVVAHETRKIEHLTPEGKVSSVETVQRVETGGGVLEEKSEGSSHGAGIDTTADAIAQTFSGSAPVLALPGGASATGGDSDSSTKGTAMLPKNLWGNPLLWAGIFCLLGAGGAFYFALRRAALVAGGTGLALIAAALYPAVLLFVAAGVLAVVVAVYLYAEHKGRSGVEALRAVVAGVAGVPEGIRDAVTAEIAKHADAADKATIKAIKRADDL